MVAALVEAEPRWDVKTMDCVGLQWVCCSKKLNGDDDSEVDSGVLIYGRLTCQLPRGPATGAEISKHGKKSNDLFTARSYQLRQVKFLRAARGNRHEG